MRHILLSLGTLCLLLPTHAQEKLQYIYSEDSINLGISMHDEENYERAIQLYEMVSPGDTNYEWAVYEKCLSLTSNEQYDEAIAASNIGIDFKNNDEGKFYNLLGTCHDLKGDKEKAIDAYTMAIERFPMDYNLYFNRAVVYDNTKDYASALKDLCKAVEINPYHSSSHLALAHLALNEEQYAQALLAFGFYLMLEPNTQRSNDNLVKFNEAVSQKIELEANGLEFENEAAFKTINQLITSYVALRADYETSSKIDLPVIKQLHLTLDQSLKIRKRVGFWENYYLPFYEYIMDNEYFEPLSYRLVVSSGNKYHKKVVSKNEKDIIAFVDAAAPKIKEIYSVHFQDYHSSNPEIKFWFQSNGNGVEAVGKVDAEGQPVGPYSFYYNSGALSTKGDFNKSGERDGEWTFYFPNGNIKGKNTYSDGQLNGPDIDYFENGLLAVESAFTDDQRDGKTCVYDQTGALLRCMNHKDGQLQDSLIYYFNNGRVETWLPMSEGLVQGEAKYYNSDGSLSSVVIWKEDSREGPFTGYYSNGNKESEGSYKENSLDGEYSSYFANGQLRSQGKYIEGTKVGEWKHFYIDGQLRKLETFDEKGKANGHQEDYDYNGHKVSSYEYSKGEIVSYKIFDRNSNVLHQAERKRGEFWYEDFTLDGVKTIEGTYTGEFKVGPWKYYYSNGALSSEETYDDNGLLQGMYTSYFPNGKTKQQRTYKNDTLNGYEASYHDNGQISNQGYNWNGRAYGHWESYHEDGSLKAKNFYVNGKYNGPQYYFDESGALKTVEDFDDGTLMKVKNCKSDSTVYNELVIGYPTPRFTTKYPNGQQRSDIAMIGEKFSGEAKWWYGNGAVQTQGTYLEGEQHGPWKYYFPNGQLKSEGNYLFGDKDGEWKWYYENGQLSSTSLYVNGKRHGEYVSYYPDGTVEAKTPYFQGDVNGKKYLYDYEGNIDHIRYYDRGVIIGYSYLGSDGEEVDMIPVSKETAVVKSYYANGKQSRQYELQNGMFIGDYIEWNDDGSIRSKGNYQHDNRDGKTVTYYPNGQVWEEEMYVNGLLHGVSLEYYTNGKLKSKKTYVNNALHGMVEEYDEEGNLKKKYLYRADNLYEEI